MTSRQAFYWAKRIREALGLPADRIPEKDRSWAVEIEVLPEHSIVLTTVESVRIYLDREYPKVQEVIDVYETPDRPNDWVVTWTRGRFIRWVALQNKATGLRSGSMIGIQAPLRNLKKVSAEEAAPILAAAEQAEAEWKRAHEQRTG